MKKTLKVALYILLALVLIVLAYVIYVFAAYYRVEDMQKLGVAHCDAASAAPMEGAPQTGVTYRVSSANVGFGAYSADYSIFMDGGKESRAPVAGKPLMRICAARSRSSRTFRPTLRSFRRSISTARAAGTSQRTLISTM